MSSIPFAPSKFTAPKAKPLPVILLLDVSGSMSGENIRNLNAAVRDMLDDFRDTENSEIEIWVLCCTTHPAGRWAAVAHDTQGCHDEIAERGAEAVIPTRKNAQPWKAKRPGAAARNETPR